MEIEGNNIRIYVQQIWPCREEIYYRQKLYSYNI